MAFTLQLGASAPAFKLPATDGRSYSLQDFNNVKLIILSKPSHNSIVL